MSADCDLVEFVRAQRWFGSKTREVSRAEVIERAVLHESDPRLELRLLEVRFDTGTHELYQLVSSEGAFDALDDPRHARELVHMIRRGARVLAEDGVVELSPTSTAGVGLALHEAKPVPNEQSNSSIVFDSALILKAFRRLEAGVNPELELLRFFTAHGFEHVPRLAGWYEYSGGHLAATLGILQEYVSGAEDGWELALRSIAGDAGAFLGRLRQLGEVTARMHNVLGSDADDPSFCPERPPAEGLGLLAATVDEEIGRTFLDLPSDARLDPIRGRGEEVRERLRALTSIGSVGLVIRQHGDFHLGQTLWARDWTILDFEGEPARSIAERRRKHSPLRDIAGMMRSFAYAASAARIIHGVETPAGWEEQARAEFIDGYLGAVDAELVPSGPAFERLLAVFELEKTVYELRYELDHRPDWVPIPVAGIVRMLDDELPA